MTAHDTEPITSAGNARLKLVRRLAARAGREREGAFAVEGEDLVLAGVRAAWSPRFVLGNEVDPPVAVVAAGVDVTPVPAELLAGVSTLAHPPRVLAVFDLPAAPAWAGAQAAHDQPSLYLDGLGDPGNVGTILRTAQAFGVRRVLLGPGTADPFSPKATRASMGAVFHVECSPVTRVEEAVPGSAHVVALDAGASIPLHEAVLGPAPVLCVGGERSGVSVEARGRADLLVAIPQRADVDSLNAAMAASVVLYEWQRQQVTGGAAT